ncbi:MAG TPA: hemerythrin domain-containing protein [Blastocatellia bacterium]|nr:hemerythrin domain-containing protein [Blastocatellia bacterium]
MDALELLRKDHRKVSDLFSQAEAAEDDKRQEQLFEQIRTELETHTYIEEKILYPTLQQHEELKEMVLEALEEHKQVKTLIREMERLTDGSERFSAKLKVMSENVEHHVEEEENEMFPKVRKLFSADELAQMGQELEAAKRDFSRQPQTSSTAS